MRAANRWASDRGALDKETASWVQLRAAGTPLRPVNALAIAAEGVAAASAPLPFREQIQRAFGRHDVSGVRAEIGGRAARATALLGARAYASADRVAFAGAPDLHTAAHEAAHVVQQRVGVQLSDGIGRDGDDYERAADAVADAVVAGRSAEVLLDRAPSGASGARGAAVQRKHDADPARIVPAWEYVEANNDAIVAAIAARLATVSLPRLERATWLAGGIVSAFPDALAAALGREVLFDKLPELVYPSSAWYVIDQHREIASGMAGLAGGGHEALGPATWQPIVGQALAGEAAIRISESLARMTPRYVVQVDEQQPKRVAPADLVASHPMDRVVAQLLCGARVVKVSPLRHAKHPSDPRAFRDGVRFLDDWRWLGETDRKLWNWIEVKAPRDATVEEVAATLWADTAASARAYLITAVPPFFRVAPEYAHVMPAAREFAPDNFAEPYGAHALEPRVISSCRPTRRSRRRPASVTPTPTVIS